MQSHNILYSYCLARTRAEGQLIWAAVLQTLAWQLQPLIKSSSRTDRSVIVDHVAVQSIIGVAGYKVTQSERFAVVMGGLIDCEEIWRT